MTLEITPHAIEVLERSLALAPHAAGVRLRIATSLGGGSMVQIELADGPSDGEEAVQAGSTHVYYDPASLASIPNPVLTVETEHERLAVRGGE
ncbi:MAG TPA: hypothetical protein VFK89_01860 [Actinomycetota bacterium]|nr:hypothetical protein [Actinomycetota bacterium]